MERIPQIAAGVLLLMASTLAAAGVASATEPGKDRRQPCGAAWSVIAREGPGLQTGDPGAWSTVSSEFISMSDASFDGPLSNALGSVSAAADGYATALLSEGDPTRVAFDSALADLGAVCASLKVTGHTDRNVPRFEHFTYETGVLSGLSPRATAIANTQIAAMVDRNVKAARRQNVPPCMAGARTCGYFALTLKRSPCIAGVVCIAQQVGLLPVGANDGQAGVTTLVIDGWTGRARALSTFVTPARTASFLADLRAVTRAELAAAGLVDHNWPPPLTLVDVRAWQPRSDGIHVWFDKNAVAPGSFGIVHVVVPWPAA
jgi:hypothetical protein